jgi:hypothetical protein
MAEKRALYFEAGAAEVWICKPSGAMEFYLIDRLEETQSSKICPSFPQRV